MTSKIDHMKKKVLTPTTISVIPGFSYYILYPSDRKIILPVYKDFLTAVL